MIDAIVIDISMKLMSNIAADIPMPPRLFILSLLYPVVFWEKIIYKSYYTINTIICGKTGDAAWPKTLFTNE
jgi:hypothetical protein